MSGYRLTPRAVDDLFEIWNFIAQDNPVAADKVEEAIFRACEFLAGTPSAGRTRKDLTDLPVRFWVVQPFNRYLIVYDPHNDPLRIIRILHAARSIGSVL